MIFYDFNLKSLSSVNHLFKRAKEDFNLYDIVTGVGNDVLVFTLYTYKVDHETTYLVQVRNDSMDDSFNRKVYIFCQSIMGELEM